MIQIYKPFNTNFAHNGDAVLHPISCPLYMKLTGEWYVSLENPIDENIDFIVENAVISINTPVGKKQLFRIRNIDKSNDKIVATAYPIFMDSANNLYLPDVHIVNKTGQDALNIMLQNSEYTGESDISKAATAYYYQTNFMEALNGDNNNSFINRWGGEISYKNKHIIVNNRIGADNGMRAEAGFNLRDIRETVDFSQVVTRIIPKSFNGYILPYNETIDSPKIINYPIVFYKVIEYQDIKLKADAQSNDAENGVTICDTLDDLYIALRNRAYQEYDKGIDLPKITYDVNIVDISKTEDYKGFENIVKVNLGDTVHVKNKRLNIETNPRVIELVWDAVFEQTERIVLGDYEANYFNETSSIINSASQVINTENNSLMADKINGIINALNVQMRAQKDIAQKQDVRAILFEDTDPESPTFGALSIGTQGIQIAKKRNETNTDWQWGTAINSESIIANYIITGILSDRLGKFYFNLDTGELSVNDGNFAGKVISTEGFIGGLQIKEDGIHSSYKRILPTNYTQSDVERLRNITLGKVVPTDADYDRLDINGDCSINIIDLQLIQQLINGVISNEWTYSFFISSQDAGNFIQYTIDMGNGKTESHSVSLGSISVENMQYINEAIVELFSKYENGATFNGVFRAGYAENEIGCFRIQNEYIGMYASFLDAINNANRKGWLGYNGLSYMTIKDEKGGGIWLYLMDGQYVGYSQPSGATYRTWEPKTDNADYLGRVGHRWRQLYAGTTTIATSDRNLKKDFTDFDERYDKFFSLLKPQLFKFKDGTSDRFHVGYIAQDVEEALKECGLSSLDFAGFCKDIKTMTVNSHEDIIVLDSEGNPEYEYSLRYSEFIALNTHMIQSQQKEIEDLKDQVRELKDLVLNLTKQGG